MIRKYAIEALEEMDEIGGKYGDFCYPVNSVEHKTLWLLRCFNFRRPNDVKKLSLIYAAYGLKDFDFSALAESVSHLKKSTDHCYVTPKQAKPLWEEIKKYGFDKLLSCLD